MGKGLARCDRCGGMMVQEKIYHGTEHFWVWKCVYCGDYIDRVILENRQIQKSNREMSMKDNRERTFKLASRGPVCLTISPSPSRRTPATLHFPNLKKPFILSKSKVTIPPRGLYKDLK